jgi:Uma2 family endonuclease
MSANLAERAERLLTLEEFERLPEDNEGRLELSRGRLVREPLPDAEHGLLTGELIGRLYAFVRERRLGIVVTRGGFILSGDPPTVREPDLAFISAARLPKDGLSGGYWRQAPDLAVEVVSCWNTYSEIQAKVLDYLDTDCRMLWVVEPETRSLTVYRSRDDIRILTMSETLSGSDVVRGFRLPLAELFEPLNA